MVNYSYTASSALQDDKNSFSSRPTIESESLSQEYDDMFVPFNKSSEVELQQKIKQIFLDHL